MKNDQKKEDYEKNPKERIRRLQNRVNMYNSAIQFLIKKANLHPKEVEEILNRIEERVDYAESRNLTKGYVIRLGETIFYLPHDKCPECYSGLEITKYSVRCMRGHIPKDLTEI